MLGCASEAPSASETRPMSTMNDAALYSLRTRRRSASVRLRRRKATTAIVWRRHRFLISQIRTCAWRVWAVVRDGVPRVVMTM